MSFEFRMHSWHTTRQTNSFCRYFSKDKLVFNDFEELDRDAHGQLNVRVTDLWDHLILVCLIVYKKQALMQIYFVFFF